MWVKTNLQVKQPVFFLGAHFRVLANPFSVRPCSRRCSARVDLLGAGVTCSDMVNDVSFSSCECRGSRAHQQAETQPGSGRLLARGPIPVLCDVAL